MTLPILTVWGALGRQGASVVSSFTSDAAPQYHIRALTSNVDSPAAKELSSKPNVSVVGIDPNSLDSIVAAFQGSSLVFANTVFQPALFLQSGASSAQEVEANQGLNIARAASRTASLKHIIWSTLPDSLSVTEGRLNVPHFQSKIPAEKYLLSSESGLANKTTFLRVGVYGSMIQGPPYYPISVEAAKARLLILPISPDVAIPFAGDETFNVGLFAKAIFSQPEKTIGRYVTGTAEFLSPRDWAKSVEKALTRRGKESRVVFVESALSEFEELWGALGTEIGVMFRYFNDYGKSSYDVGTDGRQVVTAQDLGIADLLRSSEEAAAQVEW
ncbi:hypothetical protein AK830_g7211 [Neonectria ditissima]|uniref:NmrA-like domain-containing protein n=1 Tax=Neonectria ditissima TaxID=78410 RepID=A0A0N8H6M4_9HYPO|nr:hypothetical protein AK830_g7211 [Neonectria ditissima]